MIHLEHVERHLRERDRIFLPYFLTALTHSEIAEQMGPGWTRRQVETAWMWTKVSMGLRSGSGPVMALNRIELVRIAMGLDPCMCERLALDKAA